MRSSLNYPSMSHGNVCFLNGKRGACWCLAHWKGLLFAMSYIIHLVKSSWRHWWHFGITNSFLCIILLKFIQQQSAWASLLGDRPLLCFLQKGYRVYFSELKFKNSLLLVTCADEFHLKKLVFMSCFAGWELWSAFDFQAQVCVWVLLVQHQFKFACFEYLMSLIWCLWLINHITR